MLTTDQIEEWNQDLTETPFWRAIKALTDEEREKLARLASESIRDAAQMIMNEIRKERGQ
jgi:histone H3/H4